MNDLKAVYDQRYSTGYRERLSGYEIARWKGLHHFLRQNISDVDKAKRVLDYGAGRGLHVPLWERLFRGAELHFCDISSVALDRLRSRYPHYAEHCHAVHGYRADLEDSTFDLVVSIEVLEHVHQVRPYLQDIHRLLKPGGRFVWTTPCANRMSIEHIYSILTRQIEATDNGYRRWKWEDPTHVRRLKSCEIKRLMEEEGFCALTLRFRAHFFSFVCTRLLQRRLSKLGERMMLLDYFLFRRFPNAASMIGCAIKEIC
jgi:2-polyprenyl-3-methyl-5-hydroxy-6-metoxy-1,4-benzoquinol methylase